MGEAAGLYGAPEGLKSKARGWRRGAPATRCEPRVSHPEFPRPEGAESGCLCFSIPQIRFIVLDTVLFQQSEKLFLE